MSFFRLAKEGWDSLRATLAHSDPVPIVGQKRSRENDEEIEGEGAAILKRKNDNSASPVLRETAEPRTLSTIKPEASKDGTRRSLHSSSRKVSLMRSVAEKQRKESKPVYGGVKKTEVTSRGNDRHPERTTTMSTKKVTTKSGKTNPLYHIESPLVASSAYETPISVCTARDGATSSYTASTEVSDAAKQATKSYVYPGTNVAVVSGNKKSLFPVPSGADILKLSMSNVEENNKLPATIEGADKILEWTPPQDPPTTLERETEELHEKHFNQSMDAATKEASEQDTNSADEDYASIATENVVAPLTVNEDKAKDERTHQVQPNYKDTELPSKMNNVTRTRKQLDESDRIACKVVGALTADNAIGETTSKQNDGLNATVQYMANTFATTMKQLGDTFETNMKAQNEAIKANVDANRALSDKLVDLQQWTKAEIGAVKEKQATAVVQVPEVPTSAPLTAADVVNIFYDQLRSISTGQGMQGGGPIPSLNASGINYQQLVATEAINESLEIIAARQAWGVMQNEPELRANLSQEQMERSALAYGDMVCALPDKVQEISTQFLAWCREHVAQTWQGVSDCPAPQMKPPSEHVVSDGMNTNEDPAQDHTQIDDQLELQRQQKIEKELDDILKLRNPLQDLPEKDDSDCRRNLSKTFQKPLSSNPFTQDHGTYPQSNMFVGALPSSHQAASFGESTKIRTSNGRFNRPVETQDRRSRIPCRFLKTPQGCRKGVACPFYHPEGAEKVTNSHRRRSDTGNASASVSLKRNLSPELVEAMADQLLPNRANLDQPMTHKSGLRYYYRRLAELLHGLLSSKPTLSQLKRICEELVRREELMSQAIEATAPEVMHASRLTPDNFKGFATDGIPDWYLCYGLGEGAKLPPCLAEVKLRLFKIAIKVSTKLTQRADDMLSSLGYPKLATIQQGPLRGIGTYGQSCMGRVGSPVSEAHNSALAIPGHGYRLRVPAAELAVFREQSSKQSGSFSNTFEPIRERSSRYDRKPLRPTYPVQKTPKLNTTSQEGRRQENYLKEEAEEQDQML